MVRFRRKSSQEPPVVEKPAPKKPETLEERMLRARGALTTFWGSSNGGEQAWFVCHDTLAALEIPVDQLERLRLYLPHGATGTVGQRVVAANAMLESLKHDNA